MSMESFLYECSVMHCRLLPRPHAFNYQVFMISVELTEIAALAKKNPWLGHNRFNLFSIYDRDHIDLGKEGGIRGNLLAWLAGQDVVVPVDACIRLVTFPSVLGYGFNPVSFYHLYEADGTPLLTVAEVVNTFREMKLYLVKDLQPGGIFHSRVEKNFYVSPFSDPSLDFDFRLGPLVANWCVHIDSYRGKECTLVSSIRGTRRPFTKARLLWYALKYPLLSLKIIFFIHWHAFLLWCKKIPFFKKSQRREFQTNVLRPHDSLSKNQS